MADWGEYIREVMVVTSEVGGLKSDVERLARKVDDHNDRIIRLESREELLAEKMKNVAIQGVHDLTSDIFDRMAQLQHQMRALGPGGDSSS